MSWGAARQGGLAILVVAVLASPSATTLWVSTPSGTDIQQRVQTMTARYGVVLLGEGDIPPLLVKAIVATEDERFYSHHGIDSLGLVRSVTYDIANLCLCQGGSTITEQLVKEVYLDGSDGGFNKIGRASCRERV